MGGGNERENHGERVKPSGAMYAPESPPSLPLSLVAKVKGRLG